MPPALSRELLRKMDAYWRAANYLSVGHRFAAGDFDPPGIQDLADLVPKLLEAKAKSNVAMKFHVRLELGDGSTPPSDAIVKDVNTILESLGDGFHVS